jgi:hypothetical protein
MKNKQSKLMSPSLSTTSTPCSTQAPTSIKDSLPSYGISIENAEKWNREYNYENIPRIHEDKFWELLIEAAGGASPADVESKVRSVMEQRNVRSREKFEEQAYKIMLPGAKLFQDQSQKSAFLSALDEQHTIHGFEALIANCFPVLINALQKRKAKHRQRSSTGRTRKNPESQRVSKSSSELNGQTGTRRSSRNKNPNTPPSK